MRETIKANGDVLLVIWSDDFKLIHISIFLIISQLQSHKSLSCHLMSFYFRNFSAKITDNKTDKIDIFTQLLKKRTHIPCGLSTNTIFRCVHMPYNFNQIFITGNVIFNNDILLAGLWIFLFVRQGMRH